MHDPPPESLPKGNYHIWKIASRILAPLMKPFVLALFAVPTAAEVELHCTAAGPAVSTSLRSSIAVHDDEDSEMPHPLFSKTAHPHLASATRCAAETAQSASPDCRD